MVISEDLIKEIKEIFPDFDENNNNVSSILAFLRKRLGIYMNLTEKRDIKNRVNYGFVVYDKFFNAIFFDKEIQYDTVLKTQTAMIEKAIELCRNGSLKFSDKTQHTSNIIDNADNLSGEKNALDNMKKEFTTTNADIILKMDSKFREVVQNALEYGWINGIKYIKDDTRRV